MQETIEKLKIQTHTVMSPIVQPHIVQTPTVPVPIEQTEANKEQLSFEANLNFYNETKLLKNVKEYENQEVVFENTTVRKIFVYIFSDHFTYGE